MQFNRIQIFTPEEAQEILDQLKGLEWEVGKARTDKLTGTIKKNKELKPTKDPNSLVTILAQKCAGAITRSTEFQQMTHMKQMMLPKFNNYDEPGGTYQRHTDAPWMGSVRTDFTAVLCLSPPEDYEGGVHHVVDPTCGEIEAKSKQGELLIYETGYPHWVTPVEKGQRISALTWIESSLRDARQRGLCTTLAKMSQELEKKMFDEELSDEERAQYRSWFVDTGCVHSGLHRMWGNR